MKTESDSLFERIDVGAQFVATHGPLRSFFDRQNMLSRNPAVSNPVTDGALGLQPDLVRERLLAAQNGRSALDSLFAHKGEFNAQIVRGVNAYSGSWGLNTERVIPRSNPPFQSLR